MNYKEAINEIVNIGSNDERRVIEVAKIILKDCGNRYETSVGRIIFNQAIRDVLGHYDITVTEFINETIGKKQRRFGGPVGVAQRKKDSQTQPCLVDSCGAALRSTNPLIAESITM